MIVSLGDKRSEDNFHGRSTKRARSFPQELSRIAARKLDMINAAYRLDDLRVPSDNRLEALRGELTGVYSIRVNNQRRIVLRWQDGQAADVTIVDDHR
ncbi:MAG: proteic killer suppression protein [Flavobacteriales bacterium]|jgi:proteic killer suppression protein